MDPKKASGVKCKCAPNERQEDENTGKAASENTGYQLGKFRSFEKSLLDHPLPKWVVWPLDSKVPVAQNPDSVQLYTTHVGEKIIQSYPELDFNLWDPNVHETPTQYEALHDPHLHKLFESKQFRDHLQRKGLISEDGKVLCTLKEFNNYRAYLHKLYQQLEKNKTNAGLRSRQSSRERPQLRRHTDRKDHFHKARAKIHKRRQLERLAAELGVSVFDADLETRKTNREKLTAAKRRNERLHEVLERVKNKQKVDKARLQKRLAEDNARRMRLREGKERLLAERERLQQEQYEMRLSNMKDRQFHERQRKLERIKERLAYYDMRVKALALKRQASLKQKEEKLRKHWETRKCYQVNKILMNQIKDVNAEKERKHKVEQRRRVVEQQQQQHEDELKKSAERARRRHMEQEEELKRKMKERQISDCLNREKETSQQIKRDKVYGPASGPQKSSFDLTESLLNFIKMMEEEEEKVLIEPYPDGKIDYSRRVQGVDPVTMKIYSGLPLTKLLPSYRTPKDTERDGWQNNYGLRIPKYNLVTTKFDVELATKTPQSIEEASAKCVQMVTFLASKIIYPAILRAQEEAAQKAELEKRHKIKEKYEQKERERKKREEKRPLKTKISDEGRAEMLEKQRQEKKKAEVMIAAGKPLKQKAVVGVTTPTRTTKQRTKVATPTTRATKLGKTVSERPKKKVQTDVKRVSTPRRASLVKFNLAGNVDIPIDSPADDEDSVSLEAELVHLHDSEDEDSPDDIEGAKVGANDSLTLLRKSKTNATSKTDLKPTRFASLLSTEILNTLQSVLVKPEDIFVETNDQPSKSLTEVNTKNSDVYQENKSRDDLHVTPLAKILVEQAVVSVAQKLGIDVPLSRQTSETSQHHIPMKKNVGNIKSLKDIDSKTPATVLMLAVLEAAAKQTGTPFDASLHSATKKKSSDKKIPLKKMSSREAAVNIYGTSANPSGHGKEKKVPSAIKSHSGRKTLGYHHSSRSKEVSSSKGKLSKDENLEKQKSDELVVSSGRVTSETFHLGKDLTDSGTQIDIERTTSSPQLRSEEGPTGASRPGSSLAKPEATDVEQQDETKIVNQGEPQDTAFIHEETRHEIDETEMPECAEEELPKKKSFLARISSFLLSKRSSSRSDKSGTCDQPLSEETDADGKESHPTEGKSRPTTPAGKSKSEENRSAVTGQHSRDLIGRESSPQLRDARAETEQRMTPTKSSQLINQLVRNEISRILYRAKIDYAEEINMEIHHDEEKVLSNTKIVEEIIQKQVSKVLESDEVAAIGKQQVEKQEEKSRDTQIIESAVNEEIKKVLSGKIVKDYTTKNSDNNGLTAQRSTEAFAAIANAYSSEVLISGSQNEAEQTQHPIHLAILKKIASKIEKEEEIKHKKGLERYRKDMSSMLKLEDKGSSMAFLHKVGETYKYSMREDPERCKEVSNYEDVLKYNLIAAIILIREGIMPNAQLLDLISAVVASYLIAHSMLPLAEDRSLEATSLGKYKGMEVGKWLSTPVLIDILIAEILFNVKQHLKVGTFNAVHVIMAVYGMHQNSREVVEKKESEEKLKRSSEAATESTSEEEQIISVCNAVDEGHADFVPMYGNHPLGLGEDEASQTLVALSVKDPDVINSGTDAVERNSFLSLVKPDVSKLKTFSNADKPISEEAARKHLSAVSMQFKRRSEANFGLADQVKMREAINYERLKRGSMPVMSSKKEDEKLSQESDESDDEVKRKSEDKLRRMSLATGLQITKITDPALLASGARIKKTEKKSDSASALRKKKSSKTTISPKSSTSTSLKSSGGKISQKSRSSNLNKQTDSEKSVVLGTFEAQKSLSSVGTKRSDQSSRLVKVISGYESDDEAEVPPEDPDLVRLSARREKRAQERAAEKQRQMEGGSSEELQTRSEPPSNKSSMPSAVDSPRTSHASIGTGLRPRPSSAFKSEKTHQEVEHKQIGVQTSDTTPRRQAGSETAVQVTGNEAAVQTTSSIRRCGRQGSTEASANTLALFTPLTASENWEYEYREHDTGQTTSDGVVRAAKEGRKDSDTHRQTYHDKGTTCEPFTASVENLNTAQEAKPANKKQRPYSGGEGKSSRLSPRTEKKEKKMEAEKEETKTSSTTMVEEIVEYEEITEISSASRKKEKDRRMSFVPNFTAPAPVIGSYGQQARRMSYFPGYEQKQEETRGVLEDSMDPELPSSQTNRENFVLDEDDEEQIVSPLISNASLVSRWISNTSSNTGSKQGSRKSSGSTNRSKGRSRISSGPSSGKSLQARTAESNKSNHNALNPAKSNDNSNNNNKTQVPQNSSNSSSLYEVVSPYKTGNTLLKRIHIGSTTLTTKINPKSPET